MERDCKYASIPKCTQPLAELKRLFKVLNKVDRNFKIQWGKKQFSEIKRNAYGTRRENNMESSAKANYFRIKLMIGYNTQERRLDQLWTATNGKQWTSTITLKSCLIRNFCISNKQIFSMVQRKNMASHKFYTVINRSLRFISALYNLN